MKSVFQRGNDMNDRLKFRKWCDEDEYDMIISKSILQGEGSREGYHLELGYHKFASDNWSLKWEL